MDDLPPFDDYEITHGRTYMYLQKEPLYPFGFGLSYTTFAYSNLSLDRTEARAGDTVLVRFEVTNTGGRDGDEVAQVYVRDNIPGDVRPLKRLRGFKRVHIPAGQTATVEIPIKTNDLAYWNTQEKQFKVEPGEYEILVGSSSVDLPLNAYFDIYN